MGLANNTCAFVAENATNGPVEMTAVVTDNAMFLYNLFANYMSMVKYHQMHSLYMSTAVLDLI